MADPPLPSVCVLSSTVPRSSNLVVTVFRLLPPPRYFGPTTSTRDFSLTRNLCTSHFLSVPTRSVPLTILTSDLPVKSQNDWSNRPPFRRHSHRNRCEPEPFRPLVTLRFIEGDFLWSLRRQSLTWETLRTYVYLQKRVKSVNIHRVYRELRSSKSVVVETPPHPPDRHLSPCGPDLRVETVNDRETRLFR